MDEGCWGGNGDGLFQYVRCDGSWGGKGDGWFQYIR